MTAPTHKPRGRPRGTWAAKGFRDALVRAAYRRDADGQRYLDVIAQRLVANAVAGDNVAIQQVADRLDGRLSHGNANDPQARISFVVSMPPAMTADQWQRMATAAPTLEHAPTLADEPAQHDEPCRDADTDLPCKDAQAPDADADSLGACYTFLPR